MKTKNAQTLGVHVSDEIVDLIVRRARHRGISKSKYAAEILQWWHAQKAPALNTVDSTARALVIEELKSEKKSQTKKIG
jgi:hypothetical protein